MIVYKTTISEDISNYLRLQEYEIDGNKILFDWVINSAYAHELPDKWRDEKISAIQKSFKDASFTKNLVFSDISNRSIPEKYRGEQYRLFVDFSKCEVAVDDTTSA